MAACHLMGWRRSFTVAAIAVLVGASVGPAGSAAAAGKYGYLKPGGQPRLVEKVPVNVVFIGYEPQQVGKKAFLGELAGGYEPVVRSRLNYGVTEKLGITYKYDYKLTYADRKYEDRFFRQLTKLAKP